MRGRVSRDRRSVSPDRLRVESLEARALMAVVAGVPDLLPESDSGFSSRDNKTNVAAPTFSVRAPRAEGVTLFRVGDAEPLGTGVPGSLPGTWVVTSRPLPDGVHTIRAQATGSTRLSAPLKVEIRSVATVPATVDLCSCTDSGVKGDRVTNAAAPRFVGTAAPRAVVNLAVDGGASLGTARTGARGAWALVARQPVLPDGEHVIRATATDLFGNESDAGTVAVTIDRAKPTAVIEETGIDSFRVTFSRPVAGFTSALRGMTFSGRPTGGASFGNVSLTSPRARLLIGPVVFTPSADGRVYDVSFPEFGPESGVYTIRLLAKASRVVDAVAGNPLAADAVMSFTVA